MPLPGAGAQVQAGAARDAGECREIPWTLSVSEIVVRFSALLCVGYLLLGAGAQVETEAAKDAGEVQ